MTATLKSLQKNITIAAIAFAVISIASRAEAATLAEYRARLAQATTLLQQLQNPQTHVEDEELRNSADHPLARVKSLLPLKETVVLAGESVEVNNSWLHEALEDYEKHPASDSRRREALRHTIERLQALMQRIDEGKDPSVSSDKDGNKARLAEILRRPEYDKSAAQGSAIERLWERFLRWLSKLFPKTKPLSPSTGSAVSSIAQIVVIAISIALIAFLIWKFLPRFLSTRRRKKTKREVRIVLGERLEPDQTAADLLEQAEGLARAGDLRGAIRKAYIALLCELGDRKVISLAQHKTNRDYLLAVRHKSTLYQSLSRLTNSFELHWYGFVPPVANDWDEFRMGVRTAVDVRQS
ncbi:MAG TPA: DUF4129 domain-containing protein [Pyrinomonadaceae bacterium]|nr:DUF4129 domain-containing protein [Pyrinomonadaceae bacterium]